MTTTMNGERATVRLPAGAISYRELGEGEPLIFVHGLLVDGRLWDSVAERLADRFRCIVPDWPMGSHRTAMNEDADLSPPGQARLIAEFMAAIGIERATLVGNDSGGAVSQILTAAEPERVERLVLTNCDVLERFPPFPFSLMPPIARLPGGMQALSAPFRIRAVRRATYATLAKRRIAPELVDRWLEPSMRDAAIRRDARKLIAGADKRQTIAAAEELRAFERPIRFAWAVEDRFFAVELAERLAAIVPDARIEKIADARTFVPLDQPERVAALIAGFMAEEREPEPGTARSSR